MIVAPAELWAVAGLLLCAAELIAPGVFMLWIGLAALGAGAVTAVLALFWQAQIACFIALALALIAIAVRRNRAGPARDLVNAPNAGLVGATVTAITFRAGEGRVHFRDGAWPARLDPTADGAAPAPGSLLEVVGLDGTTLLVRAVPG